MRCNAPRIIPVIAVAICLFGSTAYGAPPEKMDRDIAQIQQARHALQKRDCRGAWQILWPLAKEGNHVANYFLYMGWVADGLLPPGYSDPMRTYHYLSLTAYATLALRGPSPYGGNSNPKWARDEIPALLKGLALGADGERVAACYKSDASFEKCLTMAVSLDILPKFEDYARGIDLALQDGAVATCAPPGDR